MIHTPPLELHVSRKAHHDGSQVQLLRDWSLLAELSRTFHQVQVNIWRRAPFAIIYFIVSRSTYWTSLDSLLPQCHDILEKNHFPIIIIATTQRNGFDLQRSIHFFSFLRQCSLTLIYRVTIILPWCYSGDSYEDSDFDPCRVFESAKTTPKP